MSASKRGETVWREKLWARQASRMEVWSLEQVPKRPAPTCTVLVGKPEGVALVDSGCTQTLVREHWTVTWERNGKMVIQCIHGDVKEYPKRRVLLRVETEAQEVVVEASNRLPYDVELGRDWHKFESVAWKARGDEALVGECQALDEGASLGKEQKEDPTLKRAWEEASLGPELKGEEAGLHLETWGEVLGEEPLDPPRLPKCVMS